MIANKSIKTIEQLVQTINSAPNHFLYRGQADSAWSLASGLERVLPDSHDPERAKRLEDYSIDQFRRKFHLYNRDDARPTSRLGWLSVMQHHGVPTRLIDFTESPYVALYFAIEAYDGRRKPPFALYALDYSQVMERSVEHLKTKDITTNWANDRLGHDADETFDRVTCGDTHDIVWISEPSLVNARLDRQTGSFLFNCNRGVTVEATLASPLYVECNVVKWIIEPELYGGVFDLLRKANVTSKSLYGDLDGLARSIRMELQVYST